ncbi:unnamed protein product [Brassica oleracea]
MVRCLGGTIPAIIGKLVAGPHQGLLNFDVFSNSQFPKRPLLREWFCNGSTIIETLSFSFSTLLFHHLSPSATSAPTVSDQAVIIKSSIASLRLRTPVLEPKTLCAPSEFRASMDSPTRFAAQDYAAKYERIDVGDWESVGSSNSDDGLVISEIGICSSFWNGID